MKKILLLIIFGFSILLAQRADGNIPGEEVWGPNTIPIAMDILAERLEIEDDFAIERLGWSKDDYGKVNGVKVVVYRDLNNIKSNASLETILFSEIKLRKEKE